MKTFTIALCVLILAVVVSGQRGGGRGGRPRGGPAGGPGGRPRGGPAGGPRGRPRGGPAGGPRGRPRGGPMGGPMPCQVLNVTNSNEQLCSNECPEFTACTAPPPRPSPPTNNRRPAFMEDLEIHTCQPTTSCDDENPCPEGATCRRIRGGESKCVPNRPPRGEQPEEEDNSCKAVLSDIFRAAREERPRGRTERGAVMPSGGPMGGPIGGVPVPCQVLNVTNSNEQLCSNACPEFTACTAPPTRPSPPTNYRRPAFMEDLEIHTCLPTTSCDDENPCPEGATCRRVSVGESKCVPNRLPRREQDNSCKAVLSDIFRAARRQARRQARLQARLQARQARQP